MCGIDYKKNKTNSYRMNNIETLLERLGFLKIMNKASSEINKQTDKEVSIAPVLAMMNNNVQVVIPKSIVPDPGQFDGNRTKFEDWWREIQLFFKSNRVIETDNRITVILAYLRGDIADIYTQRKLNKLDKELETQDWNKFVKEIKTTFSDKIKAADDKQNIKSFKQEKQNTVDFMIELKTLAMKVDTDELHTIFLLKKNV